MRFHVQAIALLIMTACVPPNTSKKNDNSSGYKGEELKVFVRHAVAGPENGYALLFATTDKVKAVRVCDERATTRCGEGVPGFRELVAFDSKKIKGKGFQSKEKEPIRLAHGSKLYIYTSVDGNDFPLARMLDISDAQWEKVRAAIKTGCAGANCHVAPAGATAANEDFSASRDIFARNAKVIFQRLTEQVPEKRMPPPAAAAQLSDANRTLIVDYTKSVDPTVTQPAVLTWADVQDVVKAGCSGAACHVTANGFTRNQDLVDLLDINSYRGFPAKTRIQTKIVVGNLIGPHGTFRNEDERRKFLDFVKAQ